MKKLIYVLAVASFILKGCSDHDNRTEAGVKDMRDYLDSVKKTNSDSYDADEYWGRVETGYEEKRQHVAGNISQADEKLKKDYAEIEKDYADLKERYNKQQERIRADRERRMRLRNALYGEGVIGEDMSFAFMNAQNAAKVYENFVTTVDNNKDKYSREDWDEVKVLYEAMDTRKNEIEKELPGKDNMKIAGLKIKFATIKTFNRPGTKMDENEKAKEKGEMNGGK